MTVISTLAIAQNSPAADLALLSAAELLAAIEGVGGTDESPDTELTALGLEAAEWVATLCGVSGINGSTPTLKAEDVEETYRIVDTGPKALITARRFIADVAVTENGSALVEDIDFIVEGDAGIVRRLSADVITKWPTGKIVVTYTAGFAVVPELIKAVAADYVKMRRTQRGVDPLERSVSVEGLDSVSYRDGADGIAGFDEAARARLSRYLTHSMA